jgi:flagellar biosynthetic protein FliP
MQTEAMTMQTKIDPPASPPAAQEQDPAPRSEQPRGSRARTFLRHYAEMVVAMLLGMFVLGAALAVPLEAAGIDVSSWDKKEPELLLLSMAFTMTVPMVAWMRHRGHGWAPCWEMTAAMFVPAFLAIGLLWAEVSTDVHGLMGIEHTVMFTAMFGLMLLRLDEYTGGH